jgi:hypothetical protein
MILAFVSVFSRDRQALVQTFRDRPRLLEQKPSIRRSAFPSAISLSSVQATVAKMLNRILCDACLWTGAIPIANVRTAEVG